MKELIGHSATVFLALFAVMNPIANAAVFIGLTGDCDRAARKRIALKSIITAFCIVLFFCVLGKGIFELFGHGQSRSERRHRGGRRHPDAHRGHTRRDEDLSG